jgi:nucleotide-binding universal stress UspA family protein
VLVVYEPRGSGDRALAHAAELANTRGARLTVVTLAPQDTDPARCVVGTPAYNSGVREDAARELEQARDRLGELAGGAQFRVLIDRRDPPLPSWAAAESFDLILLGGRRGFLGRRSQRRARALRRATGAEVTVLTS